jgi:sulfite reductase alpha subunit-like flavoprotein
MDIVRKSIPIKLPISVIEDDLPTIKGRFYSIVNDPFYKNGDIIEKTNTLKICFSLHNFKESPIEEQ